MVSTILTDGYRRCMSERAGVQTVAMVVATVAGVALALLSVLIAGMRWKLAPVLDTVRRMNRSLTNPRVLRTAGSAGTQTSVIRHVGRASGRTYETPVDIISTRDGVLIALPYGTRADWLRNVLAAGSAAVVSKGETFDVDRPAIAATAEVAEHIPARTRRTLRIFGVTECVHLQRTTNGAG
jgi:deazaflavin-dependent oxidoreductase (nitroreductase family)